MPKGDGLVDVVLGPAAGKLSGKKMRVDPVRAAKWRAIGYLDRPSRVPASLGFAPPETLGPPVTEDSDIG